MACFDLQHVYRHLSKARESAEICAFANKCAFGRARGERTGGCFPIFAAMRENPFPHLIESHSLLLKKDMKRNLMHVTDRAANPARDQPQQVSSMTRITSTLETTQSQDLLAFGALLLCPRGGSFQTPTSRQLCIRPSCEGV